jgi:hypothetical protein
MTRPAISPKEPNLPPDSSSTTAQLRHDNRQLREHLAKLAALVDHYYCAYHESLSLLQRRERELASVRRRLDSKPIAVRAERR